MSIILKICFIKILIREILKKEKKNVIFFNDLDY